jgi:NAD-dependent DNA ligase
LDIRHFSFSMTHAQAKSRHAKLAEEIRGHDYAYYVEAKPAISDREYDRLYHELRDIEAQFPDLITSGLAHPARRRRAHQGIQTGPASPADDEPGQHVFRR